MALSDAFAESVVRSQMDKINALPEAQRRPTIVSLILKAKQDSRFNVPGEVTPETATALQGFETEQAQRVESLQKSIPALPPDATPEEKKRHFDNFIGESSGLKSTRRNAELESQGVATGRDLPAGDWKMGFGVDKVSDLRNVLSDHYGKPVHVVKDGDDVVYFDPEKQQMVKANFPVSAVAGHGIPMAADVAGTVIAGGTSPAGAVAKTVLKETAGSGVFTTAGEAIRLGIGKAMGVHDLSWGEIGKKSALVGGEAAAFTGGIGGVVALAKGTSNFIKGGIFNRDEAAKYGLSVEEADEVISQVNQIIKEGGGTKEVKATLAQKADDVQAASAEAQLRASQEHGQRFKERTEADQAGVTEAVDVLSQPHMLPEKGIADVVDVAKGRVAQREAKVKRIVATNTDELSRQMDDIGKIQKETVGEPTAKYLQDKADTAKAAVTKVWDDVKATGGFNPKTNTYGIDIPPGEATAALKGQFARRAKTAQTQVTARGAGGAYVPKPKGQTQDLADLNREISDLRTEIGKAHIGKSRSPSSEKDLIAMKDALVEDRRLALIKAGRMDMVNAIEAAEKQTLDYNETYVRSAVGDLLEKTPTGVPVIKSKSFVDDMLKRDDVELEQFTDVIADNPELVGQWKEGLADAWKSKAFNEAGKFNANTSKNWFKANENALEYFFTKAELNSFKKTGKFADRVAETAKRLEKFKNRANAKWGSGVLSKVDPEGITKFVTDESGSWATPKGYGVQERLSKIQFVKNMTSDHPAAWRQVQTDFKQQIRADILDPKTGRVKPDSLAKWVSDSENAKVVNEVLGSKYLRDLTSINKVVKIINKKEHRVTASEERKGLIQAFRAAFAPPLTRRGRAFTAAVTFDNAISQKRLADAILDETTIRKVADLAEHSAHTRRFFEKAFSLGFAIPDEGEE